MALMSIFTGAPRKGGLARCPHVSPGFPGARTRSLLPPRGLCPNSLQQLQTQGPAPAWPWATGSVYLLYLTRSSHLARAGGVKSLPVGWAGKLRHTDGGKMLASELSRVHVSHHVTVPLVYPGTPFGVCFPGKTNTGRDLGASCTLSLGTSSRPSWRSADQVTPRTSRRRDSPSPPASGTRVGPVLPGTPGPERPPSRWH